MTPDQIRALVLAVLFTATGWFVTRLYYQAEISQIERDVAQREKDVADANVAALSEANARSDKAIAEMARLEQLRRQQSQEHQREIKRLTTGRACLSGELVGLLNAKTLPNGQRAAVEGAAAANAGFTTDTDVAEWIDTARYYYGRCQDRVNALIQFHEGSGQTAE